VLRFRNLTISPDDPVSEWGVEGVLAALERGGLSHVRRIVRALEADPFGDFADDIAEAARLSDGPVPRLVVDVLGRLRESDSEHVAHQVRDASACSGMSQRQIAASLRIAPALLSRYSHGNTVPSAATLARIRRASREASHTLSAAQTHGSAVTTPLRA
jgi:hypothetical protein